MYVETYMEQDIYIYNPGMHVPHNVRHVEIPKGVTIIPKDTFSYCLILQSVTISDSVTEIGVAAFQNCYGLQSVTVPDSTARIGAAAFRGCHGLQSVTLPGGLTKIDAETFLDCYKLQSIAIPDSVTEIGTDAFLGCSGLRSITIPDSVTKIGAEAFRLCNSLSSVTIPKNVTGIEEGTFRGCYGLQSVTIPDSVTEIGNEAFENCDALQSVTIPQNVTVIGERAFSFCISLRSVTIPDSVAEIGREAFYCCSGLQSVTIPDGMTEIEERVFDECVGLRSVTMPDSITKIGRSAFAGCSALQSITIPDGVTEIGESAFAGCSGLRSVTIPDGVTKINRNTFIHCAALQSVIIPDNITEIDKNAFADYPELQSVTVSDNIIRIGEDVFAGCSGLQSLMYKGTDIAPFININGYGVNTFDVIKELVGHQIPLNESTVKFGIDMAHRNKLSQWVHDYSMFGEMRIRSVMNSFDGKTEESLRRCFAAQKKTGYHVPKILSELAVTAFACGIPPERLTEAFDIKYTQNLLEKNIPLVPAEACRCYYSRDICNMLIRKDKISVMAEAVSLYNRFGHRECYRHLMDFILSHAGTKTEDLRYAVDHAEEIPMEAGTTLAQIRRHRAYTESLAEVAKIETKYGKTVPGFKLTDYPCSIEPTGITYHGLTARVLDLSDKKDIALAAMLGELTNCCQCLESAGETAMMHGFLNPDAGFWVIENQDGKVKAQAEIWEKDRYTLVLDNIEFADTDDGHRAEKINQFRGVIAVWAMESGYQNIIMGCGYNELESDDMEQAPVPGLSLTVEEVFTLQEDNDADVSFEDIDEAYRYMQSEGYDPYDFVYTDADERCVYIKKDGTVSDYLMQGYDCTLTEKCPLPEHGTAKGQGDEMICE